MSLSDEEILVGILKTLKDFKQPEFEDTPYKQCWADGYNVCLDEVRKEAIKWIKSMNEERPKDWIKHFFNITESELEDE